MKIKLHFSLLLIAMAGFFVAQQANAQCRGLVLSAIDIEDEWKVTLATGDDAVDEIGSTYTFKRDGEATYTGFGVAATIYYEFTLNGSRLTLRPAFGDGYDVYCVELMDGMLVMTLIESTTYDLSGEFELMLDPA